MSRASVQPQQDQLHGWLHKWTNYIKGYRQRWFILDKTGRLHYYRNEAEVNHTCRGVINLQGAFIQTENSCNFVVAGGTQTFHLKAANEVERQKWVTALELARHRAIKAAESDEEEELKLEASELHRDGDHRTELSNTLKMLQAKIDDLLTCQDLIAKHGSNLQKCLSEVESVQNGDVNSRIKMVNERATLFRITTNAMINACNEFVGLAQSHSKKWQRLLQHEHQQRLQLQDQLEQLAKQHSLLERAAMKQRPGNEFPPMMPAYSDSDDDAVYHDAAEDVQELSAVATSESTKPKGPRGVRRTASEVSGDHDEDDVSCNERTISAKDFFRARIVTRPSETEKEKSREQSEERGRPAEVKRVRRATLPPKPAHGLSLWSIMRNCIGKELSRIPMPVNFNEPLSVLQRITEDLEYADILDRAATKKDSTEQMCYVAAFTVSSYSTTANRPTKPFNPLLGETYECDRTEDLGWRSFCEQVSHHPPVAAHHCESTTHGWKCCQEFSMASKFRGKYLSVIPTGIAHLDFENTGWHYSWRKVTTTVHNIIVGKLWIDNHGEMTIENHVTGDKCHLKYIPYSYFSRDVPRKVTGVVTDKNGVVHWVIQGTWDSHIECLRVVASNEKSGKPVYETLRARTIWERNPPLPGCERFYNFTKLAVELNEPEGNVAPTDTRLRPDQRLMEAGDWDTANKEKLRLEDKQRAVRRRTEEEAEQAMVQGRPYSEHEPVWFSKQKDKWTNGVLHMFTDQYWKCKTEQKWEKCPDIY